MAERVGCDTTAKRELALTLGVQREARTTHFDSDIVTESGGWPGAFSGALSQNGLS
eukprot:CAMPEP_0117497464 /NCGR_PEP_ID=MMETSP0784-20121206/21196_1 /TAXON_ID=39447 /ORGANISM="" /LENGTH=55 /DNA_ID=CAMNT_0005292487 /DNA_START=146 /DNA_END=310 /DNA_ORIENTATION=-